MMLILTLLAVHLCRGSDIFASYIDLFTSSLIFTLLHYEIVARLLKFHDRDKQVFIIFFVLLTQSVLRTSAVELNV